MNNPFLFESTIRTKHGDVLVRVFNYGDETSENLSISTEIISGDPCMGQPMWIVTDIIDPDGVADVTRTASYRRALICVIDARESCGENFDGVGTIDLHNRAMKVLAENDDITMKVGMLIEGYSEG